MRFYEVATLSDRDLKQRSSIVKKARLILVSEESELIDKLKSLLSSPEWGGLVDFDVFSNKAWIENLESPFLRSGLMGKPMNLPGSLSSVESEESGVHIHNQKISADNMSNVVSFPRTGQLTGQLVKMEQIEKAAILQAIESCRGNISLVAKALGLGRATLYRKLKFYEIDMGKVKSKRRRSVTAA